MKQQETRIVIANVGSDTNRGDLAILINTMRLLKKFFPHSQIYLCASFGFNDIKFMRKKELRQMARMKIDVYGGLLPTYYSKKETTFKLIPFDKCLEGTYSKTESLPRAKRYLRYSSSLIFAFFLLLSSSLGVLRFFRFAFPAELRRTLDVFLSSDLVIIKGGGYITSPVAKARHRLLGAYQTFRHLFPALFAITIKKPYALVGHSVWSLDARLSRFLFQKIAERAILVTLREELSYNYVRALGLSANTKCLPDLAFLKAFKSRACKVELESSRPLVGITVRYFPFFKSRTPGKLLDNYIATIVRFINYIVKVYGCSVILIPHAISEVFLHEDDTLITKSIARKVNSDFVQVLDTSEMSIEELIDVYSKLEVLVATRTHSSIFAFHANTPAILISYVGPKAPGIMKMLGLQENVLDIYQITFDDLVAKFQKVWEEKEKTKSEIQDKMKKLNHEVLLHGVFLKKAVNSYRSTM